MSYRPIFSIKPNDPISDPRGYRCYPFVIQDEIGRVHDRCSSMEEAEERREYLDWERSLEVGRRVGGHLDDVRTVHSRAKTALEYASRRELDPEEAHAYADLHTVVVLLDRWKRTGRPPKRRK